MRKRLGAFLDELHDLPVEVTEVANTGSCHFKVYLTHRGRRRFFICAGSPSDYRAIRNFKGEVTRWVRQLENPTNDVHHTKGEINAP